LGESLGTFTKANQPLTKIKPMTKILVMQYLVVYSNNAREHIRYIDKKYRSLIRTAIEKQLVYESQVKTMNRKFIGNSYAFGTWELRCGSGNRFRIFYDIDENASVVIITAIGIKRRNRLFIGNQEVPL
jgi:mRNA-degrading endonuclease RelE of RelBE toxin-antitoxin system